MKLCRHVKTNGRRCGSPRLRNEPFCYFHMNSIHRQGNMIQHSSSIHCGTATYKPIIPPLQITLPVLEDAEAIQLSLSMLVAAIATDRIDTKRAALMLYGLQLASSNIRNITPPKPGDIVQNLQPSCGGTDLVPEDEPDEERNDEPEETLDAPPHQERLEAGNWETALESRTAGEPH